MTQLTLGIDVGASTTRTAVVDAAGRVYVYRALDTPADDSGDALVRLLVGGAKDIAHEAGITLEDIPAVGLALPGLVDPQNGTLRRCVNLPGLTGRPMRDELTRAFGCPVVVMTDAQAATWGEYACRTQRPDCFVHLRIGTGVACGVARGGEFLGLDDGRTAHLSTLVVETGKTARPCLCGQRGCLETIASGVALTARMSQLGWTADLSQLQHEFDHGTPDAITVVAETAQAMARALDNLTAAYHPDVISVGGGVIIHAPCLLTEAVSRFDSGHGATSIEASRLADRAGVIGAALLAAAAPPAFRAPGASETNPRP